MKAAIKSRRHHLLALRKYYKKVLDTEPADLIQFLRMSELSGSVAYDISGQGNNGAYTAATLGQPGIGDRGTSVKFEGATSYLNAFSAGLAGDFNGAEGTVLLWANPLSAGVWTDGAIRNLFDIRVDASNLVSISKTATNNIIQFVYSAGGTAQFHNAGSQSWVIPTALAISWSAAADYAGYYIAGSLVSSDSGLGAWSGSIVSSIIGAVNTTPIQVWNGCLAGYALWKKALTAAQKANLSRI